MGTFKWNPSEYSTNSQAQYKLANELISKIKLSGNEAFLDIGCGDGKITAQLALLLPDGNVTGVDSSHDMIDFAKRNFSSDKYYNLKFALMDAQRLTFESEFDIAFSNAALHWIPGTHIDILKGVRRALKPDGRLFFQMGGTGNADDILNIGDEVIKTERWNTYFKDFNFKYNFPSDADYQQWLNAAGLKIVRVELLRKDMEQNGIEGLSAWMRTTWLPYLQRLPENLKDVFVADIVERYIKGFPPDSTGKIHIKMVRLEVEACN
jgi:trans-aconitate methyltransferase